MTPIVCDCPKCASMCAHSVCMPTPEQARELVRKGYGKRLGVYVWNGGSYIAPATVGHEGATLPHTNMGACTFFKDGLCELHDKGLKPLEGRLAHHDRDWREVRIVAINTWRGRAFDSVKAQLDKAIS